VTFFRGNNLKCPEVEKLTANDIMNLEEEYVFGPRNDPTDQFRKSIEIVEEAGLPEKLQQLLIEEITQTFLKNDKFEQLLIESRTLSLDSIKTLAKISRIANLKTLRLHACDLNTDSAALIADCLKKNHTLVSLRLSCNKIGDQGAIKIFDALKMNDTLEDIGFHWNNLTVDSTLAMAECLKTNPHVQEIRYQGNHVGVAGATALGKALKVNTKLKILSLNQTHLGPEEVWEIIKSLVYNSTLQELSFRDNNLDTSTKERARKMDIRRIALGLDNTD